MSDITHNADEGMPVLFVGHGSPMNAIEDNHFTRNWQQVGKMLPRPKAILCISAHWETRGAQVTAMESPRTIRDFGGFPEELYQVNYPAPGSPSLAREIQQLLKNTTVALDYEWGLDHGCWSILHHMYPDADIPVVQLSLDRTCAAAGHYALARELLPLRQQGVLIMGCGNLVHNLRLIAMRGRDLNTPFGFDWAEEATAIFRRRIVEKHHQQLIDFPSLGDAVQLAVPTPEHYLPLLYILALQQQNESVLFFNDYHVGGSLSMTSLIIASEKQLANYAGALSDKPAE
jgi:4,5-DOPA dioxygenase extradiol